MPAPRFAHTVQLTPEMEAAWKQYQTEREQPESFNAFVNRLIQQEMELLCVTTTKI